MLACTQGGSACASSPTSPSAINPVHHPLKSTKSDPTGAATRGLTHKSHRDAATHNHLTSSPPEHSFVPVTPATQSSPRADHKVIIHPMPSEDAPLQPPPHSTVTVAEVHVPPEPVAATPAADVGVEWPRRHLRTPSLSSSERGSNR